MAENEEKTTEAQEVKQPAEKKKTNWLKLSIIANILLVVVIAGIGAGSYVLHLSNTDPQFCATCHIMAFNVDSYTNSNNLDNLHEQAGVQCKDCHDYTVQAEIDSGIKYVTGNYVVGENGELEQRTYDDTMCTKCHISLDHVAKLTSYLDKNPHNSHLGALACNTCHVSHGEQIDYCSRCHDHGEQEMIGADDEKTTE